MVSFTWFAMVGAVVVVAVGLLFRTPEHVLEQAKRREEEAAIGEDVPLALRRRTRVIPGSTTPASGPGASGEV